MAGVCWTIDYYMEKKSVFKYLVEDILFTNKVIKTIHSIHYEMDTGRCQACDARLSNVLRSSRKKKIEVQAFGMIRKISTMLYEAENEEYEKF